MTVLTNALLNGVANICNNQSATINDITVGGQLGVGPRLANIDGATPLVFAPAIPIITHIPTMFTPAAGTATTSSTTSQGSTMGGVLKALIERHSKTITGVDFGYEMDEGSAYVLADGQEAKIPTKNKRSQISPNMTFAEIQGNLVWNFFRQWMMMISNPDTHFSSMASMANGNDSLAPYVYSYFSMDMLLISFDPTMLPQNIIDAVFITTMWPKTTGQLGMKREIATAETPERSIDFNGIVQHNSNVYQAAVAIAQTLQLHRENFQFATPIATSIEPAAQNMGLQQEVTDIMNNFQLNSSDTSGNSTSTGVTTPGSGF